MGQKGDGGLLLVGGEFGGPREVIGWAGEVMSTNWTRESSRNRRFLAVADFVNGGINLL